MLNLDFEKKDCIYIDDDKAVIFSPFTQETLLCDLNAAQFIDQIDKNSKFTLNTHPLYTLHGVEKLVDKLIVMRILLKE